MKVNTIYADQTNKNTYSLLNLRLVIYCKLVRTTLQYITGQVPDGFAEPINRAIKAIG